MKEVIFAGDPPKVRRPVDKYLRPEESLVPEGYVRAVVFSILNATQIAGLEGGKRLDAVLRHDMLTGDRLESLGNMHHIRRWLCETLLVACREAASSYPGRK